nr:hypothetical protein [Tanacetum cinerariifolium]
TISIPSTPTMITIILPAPPQTPSPVTLSVLPLASSRSDAQESKSSSGELDSTRPCISKSLLLERNTLSGFSKGVISSLMELLVMHHLKNMGEQIRCLDFKDQYVVMSRRVDTSYPTGGYGVSIDLSEQDT